MTPRILIALAAVASLTSGCSPTIRVQIDPITIHAKLEADVRLHLDEDVKRLIEDNPSLF
jgi:hypothetical protein